MSKKEHSYFDILVLLLLAGLLVVMAVPLVAGVQSAENPAEYQHTHPMDLPSSVS